MVEYWLIAIVLLAVAIILLLANLIFLCVTRCCWSSQSRQRPTCTNVTTPSGCSTQSSNVSPISTLQSVSEENLKRTALTTATAPNPVQHVPRGKRDNLYAIQSLEHLRNTRLQHCHHTTSNGGDICAAAALRRTHQTVKPAGGRRAHSLILTDQLPMHQSVSKMPPIIENELQRQYHGTAGPCSSIDTPGGSCQTLPSRGIRPRPHQPPSYEQLYPFGYRNRITVKGDSTGSLVKPQRYVKLQCHLCGSLAACNHEEGTTRQPTMPTLGLKNQQRLELMDI